MQAIMVANPKGGAGKTTLATNLCGYFARQGNNVVLCDLDRQQSSLRWLSLREENFPAITGYFAGNQISANLPRDADQVVVDCPAGLQGYKLNDYLRRADKVIVPLVPSVFDMAATEDFLTTVRTELRGSAQKIGVVAMRIDPRTRAATMLQEFLSELGLPIRAHVRSTQNYVNAAIGGGTIFDPPHARYRRDVEQWQPLIDWLNQH